MSTEWRNWSGLASTRPWRTVTPASPEVLVEEVRLAREEGRAVKMVGTGHSFTPIAVPRHTLLLPDDLTGLVHVDRQAGTATAYAGTPLHQLNAALAGLGLSLHNMGDIAEQTLAGAISTGTHGTGGKVASLSAQVVALELVTGHGELLRASANENADVWEFARLGLGALGVLTTVTFRVEPLFALEAVERAMPWQEAVESFDDLVDGADHLDMYWFPHTDRMLTKRNTRLASVDDARPRSALRRWFDDDFAQDRALGAYTAAANHARRVVPRMNRAVTRLQTARTYSDIAHRVFTTRRTVVFKEMEYAVPRALGRDVLREVRRLIEGSGLAISFPLEFRVAPADDVPLSTAYRRDVVYIAAHTHVGAEHRAYFDLLEPLLLEAGGRPHWGKLHSLDAAALAERYDRMAEFLALRDRLDPDRVFANDHLDRILGP